MGGGWWWGKRGGGIVLPVDYRYYKSRLIRNLFNGFVIGSILSGEGKKESTGRWLRFMWQGGRVRGRTGGREGGKNGGIYVCMICVCINLIQVCHSREER